MANMSSTIDPSLERLHATRTEWADSRHEPSKLRLFQSITDHLYHNSPILKNQTVTLHCQHMRDGFGDVSQTFRAAGIIKKNEPNRNIQILIQSENPDLVKRIFPTGSFPTLFMGGGYHEECAFFEKLTREGYMLGISQPVSVAGPYQRNSIHRTIKEYGFGNHSDTKDNTLSMGLLGLEEGIIIPEVTPRRLSDLETDWLKNGLGIEDEANYLAQHHLYHMYVPIWDMQILSLYTIATTEGKNPQGIDVFMNLSHSLKELIEWKILDVDFLRSMGIGRISVTKQDSKESIIIGDGKELRIFSGSIPKRDMEAIQQASQRLFGCTGDCSFSEAVALDKLPFYDAPSHKSAFQDSVLQLAISMKLESLTTFMQAIKNFNLTTGKILETAYSHPRFKKNCYYASDPSAELTSNEHSFGRYIATQVAPMLPRTAIEMARLLENPKTWEEASRLNQMIQRNYNFRGRLLEIVNRGIFLQNHPDLFKVESALWEQFRTGAMTLDQVSENLTRAIESCLKDDAASSSPISSSSSDDISPDMTSSDRTDDIEI